jgi:hypothetical protein
VEQLGYYVPGVNEWTFSASLRLKLRNKNTVDFQVMLMNAFDDDRLTPASFAPNGREFRMGLKYTY